MLACFVLGAHAASLDEIEVGGPFGTPGATNPTALWWNPAGLVAEGGTQLLIGVPATLRSEAIVRQGSDVPETFAADRVVPFVGVSSDFAIDNLGVGVGMFVPVARNLVSDLELGPNRFALRSAQIRVMYATLGVAYRVGPRVAVGGSASLVDSTWRMDLDSSLYPDLAGPGGDPSRIEDPAYSATSSFDLSAQALTFGAGVRVRPLGDDRLAVALAYAHGVGIVNTGKVSLATACPPAEDPELRDVAVLRGLCDARVAAVGSIGSRIPSRVHAGVVARPTDALRLELFGSFVRWSRLADVDVVVEVQPGQLNAVDPRDAADGAAILSRHQPWARDHRDSGFVGLDGKVRLTGGFGVGARVTYDRAAIPDRAVSAASVDHDDLILAGMAFVAPVEQLRVGLSVSHHVLTPRAVSDSAFRASLDPDAVAPRFDYPQTNGTYTGGIERISLIVQGRFGTREGAW